MVPAAQRCAVMVGAASAGVVALPGHLCGAWGAQHAALCKASLIAKGLERFSPFKLPAAGRRAHTQGVPRIIRRGGGAEEPTSAKASGGSSAGGAKRAAPPPYSEAELDTNATTATPLTRRAAVRFGAAADHL